MRKIISAAATVATTGSLVLTALVALPGTAMAGAPACPSGSFCAWQHSSYSGHREAWYGDDHYWGNNDNINNQDSSWVNHGVTGPGVKSCVQVYDGYFLGGEETIRLAAGQEIGYFAPANDRGSSHTWTDNC